MLMTESSRSSYFGLADASGASRVFRSPHVPSDLVAGDTSFPLGLGQLQCFRDSCELVEGSLEILDDLLRYDFGRL